MYPAVVLRSKGSEPRREDKPGKEGKKRDRRMNAKNADRYELYQRAVNSPETDIDFLEKAYAHFGQLVTARHIRVEPCSWSGHISMRAAVVVQKARGTPPEALGPWLYTLLDGQSALAVENLDLETINASRAARKWYWPSWMSGSRTR